MNASAVQICFDLSCTEGLLCSLHYVAVPVACRPLLLFGVSGAESPVLGKDLQECADTSDQYRLSALCSTHKSANR